MPAIGTGTRVRVLTRATTSEDAKSGLYYAHFAGLTGVVQHIYDQDEVSVEVEPESLTAEVRARHASVRDQMKTKWLDGLSEEGRSKLTERERDFKLRYVILVARKDLEAIPKAGAPPQTTKAATVDSTDASSRRPTSDDLSKAEEEELLKRQKRS